MQHKTILLFANGKFEQKLSTYIKNKRYRVALIEPATIYHWQFKLWQNASGKHSGYITSPEGKIYDLSDISGIYLNKFHMPAVSEYEYNAWHALFSWLSYTIPNTLQTYAALNNFNTYKIKQEVIRNNIKFSNKLSSHYVHCISNSVFASTKRLQMAILPPKLAKSIIAAMQSLNLNCGQFELRLEAGRWYCCDFTPITSWESCAFPTEFVYQEITNFLVRDNTGFWLRCDSYHNTKPTALTNENFIAEALLPKLANTYYKPSLVCAAS